MTFFSSDFHLFKNTDVTYVNNAEKFQQIPTIQQDSFQYLKSAENTANTVRYVFVRHGQTHTNASGGLPGSRTSNDPLTSKGEEQALECGKALKETSLSFDAVYLSPTLRTRQTLEKIQNEFDSILTLIEDERLHEKNHGKYEQYGSMDEEGRTKLKEDYKSIKTREIDGPDKTFAEKFAHSPEPGEVESLSDIYSRVASFIEETYARSKKEGANYLVISHFGVLKTLFMQDAFKRGFDIDYRVHDLKNCGVVVIEMNAQGIQMVATNGIRFTPKKIATH